MFVKQPLASQGLLIIKSIKSRFVWYRCYYLHRSRDALSPVCGIFSKCKYRQTALQLYVTGINFGGTNNGQKNTADIANRNYGQQQQQQQKQSGDGCCCVAQSEQCSAGLSQGGGDDLVGQVTVVLSSPQYSVLTTQLSSVQCPHYSASVSSTVSLPLQGLINERIVNRPGGGQETLTCGQSAHLVV